MTCDRCEEARGKGMRYCPYCGEELRDGCPECERCRAEGARFCVACGRRLGTEPPAAPHPIAPDTRILLRKIVLLMLPVAVFMLAAETCYLIGGISTVFDWCADKTMSILGLVPMLVVLGTISGTALQIAWLLIVAAIVASLAVLGWQSLHAFKENEGDILQRLERMPVSTVGAMFSLMLALNIIVMVISTALGEPIEVPDGMASGNVPQALLDYADAAVWEEVISRIVPVGIPMAIAMLVSRRKGWLKAVLGGFGMSKFSIALIVISSVIFGFAHMSGWGISKVVPTFLTGIIMGYLFVRIGVHASIAFHFLVDYMSVISYTSLMVPMALVLLVTIAVGFVCLALTVLELKDSKERIEALPSWIPEAQESIPRRRERD